MLTLEPLQAETLWDEVLPIEARVLPEDLAKLNRLVSDPGLLRAIAEHWRREVAGRKYGAERRSSEDRRRRPMYA